MSTRSIVGYCAIVLAGAVLATIVRLDATHDFAETQAHYIQESHAQSEAAARRVEAAFKTIYENLRILTLLPSVRTVDRHGTNLGMEGRGTIQQVYNNLASNVSVSEVLYRPGRS